MPNFVTQLPHSTPEAVGLSSTRLARLSDRLQRGTDAKEIPGAVALVARRGHVVYENSFGLLDPAAGTAMRPDALFRIASMSKPITSTAILMLAEQGQLSISEPVAKYLPEFAALQVGVQDANGQITLEPVKQAMTIQDLLRHTSGLGYGFTGNHPIKRAYNADKIGRPGDTNAQLITKLAQQPLLHQPGTTWEYSVSTDVLGRIVEVVSGQSLDQFVDAHIAKPLKLVDTGFSAPAEQAPRSAFPQPEGPQNAMPIIPKPTDVLAFKSGGGGMVSTISDYARLCQFWLNGGELEGVRLLSRKTVAWMTSDHLPPGTAMGPDMGYFGTQLPTPAVGLGFGLGFAVRTAQGRNPLPGSVGDFSWSGIYGTFFWVDPQEELFAILMMQSPEMRIPYRLVMRDMVYQAMAD